MYDLYIYCSGSWGNIVMSDVNVNVTLIVMSDVDVNAVLIVMSDINVNAVFGFGKGDYGDVHLQMNC